MEKTVQVMDEWGNRYYPTYPKRARGLVKHGRARFTDANTICLACPPSDALEDEQMTESVNATAQTDGSVQKNTEMPTMGYLLRQIEEIARQTDYLHKAIAALMEMGDGDSGSAGSPGNLLGQQKARALGEIVTSREATNQRLLDIYAQMYIDLRTQRPAEPA